jgi:hypothetical protein
LPAKASSNIAASFGASSLASQLLQRFARGVALWSTRICRSPACRRRRPRILQRALGRLRWQASSYKGARGVALWSTRTCRSPACRRRRPRILQRAFGPLRWQASSYKGWRGALRCGRRGFVGARLAGEGVLEYCNRLSGLFAGKPAPTKVCAGRCVVVDADL